MKAFLLCLLILSVSVRAKNAGAGDPGDFPPEILDSKGEDFHAEGAGDVNETDFALDQADHEFDEADQDAEVTDDERLPEADEGSEEEETSAPESDVPHPVQMGGYMLNPYDPNDRLTKFYGISKALKKYEEKYIECFEALADPDFLQSELDKCTGKEFRHVHNGLDYERRKVVAWADKTLHKVMIEHCYEEADTDPFASEACDLFKKDLLTLLWNEMPMKRLLEMHRIKYLRDRGQMQPVVFSKLLEKVGDVEEEYDGLIEEVESHREATVHQIKLYIKRRVDDIQDRFNRGEYKLYPRIKNDLIQWTERLIETPDYTLDLGALSRKLTKNNHVGNRGGVSQTMPARRGSKVVVKATKTRNFQKSFVSDWLLSDGRKLRKDPARRPGNYDSGENPPLNPLEKALRDRERHKVDRFQFFQKH